MEEPQLKELNTTPQKRWKKPVAISLLVIAFIGSLAGIYLWQQSKINNLQSANDSKLLNLQKDISSLRGKVSSPNGDANKVESTTKPVVYSEKMPNGKTISYPLTDKNAKIIWWYGGRGDNSNEPNGTYIYATSTDVVHFLSEIESDYLRTACGTDNAWRLGLNDMYLYAIATDTKQVTKGSALPCWGQLSDSRFDKVGKYKQRATDLLAKEQADVEAFAKTITIQ